MVDTSSFVATNKKVVDEEVARKKEEYRNSLQILKLSEFCAKNKVSLIRILNISERTQSTQR